MHFNFILASHNRKTGLIPQTYSSKETCPSCCVFKGSGCYAECGNTAIHWRKNTNKSWEDLLTNVEKLPSGQLWRHNVAGDLPGIDNKIDIKMLDQLVRANKGKKGFTFTHKPVSISQYRVNAQAIYAANKSGFTINLSADNLKEADRKANLGIGPVVVVLPENAPKKLKTPEGKAVIVCPAQEHDNVTCKSCKLCSIANRKVIIGFRAHGIQRKKVSLKVMQ